MDLELALNVEDAGKPALLNGLLKGRVGRSRSQALHVVWHDSPERALAAEGMALSEQRGTWRLEKLSPDGAGWAPGAPPPILEAAGRQDALTRRLPDGLTPVAAFDGRQSLTTAATADGPVVVRLTRGSIRTVTAQHPAARLHIEGSDSAVRGLALTLASGMRLSLPTSTLAAEALAVADGKEPRPHRLGAAELPDGIAAEGGDAIAQAFRHVLGHLVEVMLHHAAEALSGRNDIEAVHQMRVAVRRARSAIAVFRHALPEGPLTEATQTLKTLARHLGPTRDWDVFVSETLPAIAGRFPDDARLGRLLAAAERRQRQCRSALHAYLGTSEFRIAMIGLGWFAASAAWHTTATGAAPAAEAPTSAQDAAPGAEPQPVPPAGAERPPLEVFAEAALERRRKKLVSAGKSIRKLDLPSLHRLRLRTKRLRYAAEVLAGLYGGKAPRRFIHRLAVLQQRLGVLNDGKVAADLLAELGGDSGRHAYAVGLVMGFAAARAMQIRPKALDAWEKFRAAEPFWT
ncbi:MAG TPA: CHAD domain-containing protein [Acetobacteraceae bacterium]|nr:CHAD domain-containing protein [Acetobacteraceae bacterium]